MKNRASGLLLAVWLWLLPLVPLSACSPTTVATTPAPESGEHIVPSAIISHQPEAPLVLGRQQFDLTPYSKLPLNSSQLEVSSTFRPFYDKANLIQPGVKGFWHVKVPKEKTRPWVLVDMRTRQSVAVLGILARQDADQTMWHGYRAVLEASDDRQNWFLLARLGLPGETAKEERIYFPIPSPQAYRYYRFSTHDWCFESMARMDLYQPRGSMKEGR